MNLVLGLVTKVLTSSFFKWNSCKGVNASAFISCSIFFCKGSSVTLVELSNSLTIAVLLWFLFFFKLTNLVSSSFNKVSNSCFVNWVLTKNVLYSDSVSVEFLSDFKSWELIAINKTRIRNFIKRRRN